MKFNPKKEKKNIFRRVDTYNLFYISENIKNKIKKGKREIFFKTLYALRKFGAIWQFFDFLSTML